MRAAYLALLLGLAGGLGLATAVLSGVHPPSTVAGVLALDDRDLDARRAAAVAVLTSACMHSLGFDWLAIADPPPDVPDASLDPIAWADRWGFGVSTTLEQPSPTSVPDRNLERLARMPVAEQARVRAALHGSADRPGCAETANGDVFGVRDRLLAPLRPALAELDAEIGADPIAAQALELWSSCVTPISEGLSVERRSLAGALVQRFAERLGPDTPDPDQLRSLQADERHVAGVLARCEAAFATARAEAAAPHEAAFVARTRAHLEAIGAAIRAAEAAWPTLPP